MITKEIAQSDINWNQLRSETQFLKQIETFTFRFAFLAKSRIRKEFKILGAREFKTPTEKTKPKIQSPILRPLSF